MAIHEAGGFDFVDLKVFTPHAAFRIELHLWPVDSFEDLNRETARRFEAVVERPVAQC